jgi:hypothetical protein
LVNKISDFYDVPQKAREDGLTSEIFIVKDESLDELNARNIRLDRSSERRELKTEEDIAKFEQSIKLQAKDRLGVYESTQFQGKKRGAVLLKESASSKKNKIHELLHSMGSMGDLRTLGERNSLNEAVTEILALHLEYPDLDAYDLHSRINNGEINDASYTEEVCKMLEIISLTEQKSAGLFTIKDLAKYYFYGSQLQDNNPADLMIEEISQKIGPELQQSTVACLNNDFRGMIVRKMQPASLEK